MEKLFFRFECGNERALSLLSELSKRRQFYYIVGNCWLYPNTLAKVQLILRCNGNSGIWCFANRIHHTSNPTGPTNVGPDISTFVFIYT